MIQKVHGEQRYCLEESIPVVAICLPKISRDAYYSPTGFLFAMERGQVTLSDSTLLTEKMITIKTQIEYPHHYFGYKAQAEDNTYYTNQFPTYKRSPSFLAGIAMANEYDYVWCLEKDGQPRDEVYIDTRYFHIEQPFTSPYTQQLIKTLFPCD